MKKKMTIAIMTSGGDAPGMNAVVANLYKYAHQKYHLVLVKNAYQGLVNDQFLNIDEKCLRIFEHTAGTFLGSLRFEQFVQLEMQKKAVENLKKQQVDVLIVIGGNGSYEGARCLVRHGIKVICIPSTIDNDVDSTDLAIGFPTALQTLHDYLLKVNSTAVSHARISLVEVMGRYCADLTFFSAISSFADLASSRENYLSPEDMVRQLREVLQYKNSALIVVCERLYGTEGRPNLPDVARYLEKTLQKKVNLCIPGYLQRGGEPCALDCVLAGMMSYYAIALIDKGILNQMIGYLDGKIMAVEIGKKTEKKKCQLFAKMINNFHW